jgi:hypothetical protein
MKYLITLLSLVSITASAEKLAYIYQNRVIDILESDDPRINKVKKFTNTLVPIGDEFKEGDWIFNGQKLADQPTKNHILDENGNWYLPEEFLQEEIKENAKKAKMIEIREMMKKGSLTNVEMRKIIRLLLEHLGHLEAE